MYAVFVGCCARVASGHAAAAAPKSLMNSRRLITSPEAQDGASYLINRQLWKGQCPVIPENLIRADSRHEAESAHHSA